MVRCCGWRVIRIDIDSRFKPHIVADVRAMLECRPAFQSNHTDLSALKSSKLQ